MKENIPIKKVQKFIKILPDFKHFIVEPTSGGVSTDVYKLIKNSTVFYIRFSKPNQNVSTEVLAHNLMLRKGVKVPKVIVFEDFNKQINRSYMITSEIKGIRAKKCKKNLKKIIYEAGKQIALVNTIVVDGFGDFDVSKYNTTKLIGTSSAYDVFDMNRIENMLKDLLVQNIIDKPVVKKSLNYIKKNKNLIVCKQAHLAHGDFDLGHVFAYQGKYSGIIDFGDIRAVSLYRDLTHFYIYNNEYFEDLLSGYQEVTKLDSGYKEKIETLALVIAIGKLWWISKNIPDVLKKRHTERNLIYELIT